MSLNSPSVIDTPTSSSGRSPISSSTTPTPATVYSAQTSFPFNANKRVSTQSIQRVLDEAAAGLAASQPYAMHASSSVPPANRQPQATPPPSRPSTSMDHNVHQAAQVVPHSQTLPLPASEGDSQDDPRRRKSYDDGVRPLSHFLGQTSKPGTNGLGANAGSTGGAELGVPGMTRAEKRRSINPGLYLDGATIAKSIAEAGASGPTSSSPTTTVNGRLSPNPNGSPLRRSFGSDGPASPGVEQQSSLYFSAQQSPLPDSIPRGSGSRSPSPAPGTSQSYPSNLNQGLHTPPSLNVTVPTPGHTPAKGSLGQLYEPLRTNSLPHPDQHQRMGRSPSPAPGGRNSPMLGNGVNGGGRRSPSSARSDGFETDGDVVVVPREGRKSSDTQSDKPPPPPPKEGGQFQRDRSASGSVTSPVPAEIDASESEGDLLEYIMDDRIEPKTKEPIVAPALPPMRFSISDTDFSSLLKQVDPSIRITLDSDEEKEKKEAARKKSVDAESSTGSLAIRESPSPLDEFSADESYMFDEGDVTIVLAPGIKDGLGSSADGTSGSPIASTPTSVTTVRDKSLAVDIPSDAPQDDTPPTPPPSSAKSTSSMTSAPFPTTHARATTAPMTLHQSAVLHATEQTQRQRVDSSASVPSLAVTPPAGTPPASGSLPTINISGVLNSNNNNRPTIVRTDSTSVDLVARRLREALTDSNERGLTNVKFDREFVEAIVRSLDGTKEKAMDLKGQIDTMKRTSQQYLAGFSVAQSEYHKEVAARRDAEAEITRLRVQLSGQAARLTAMSAEHRRQEMMEQMSKDLSSNLGILEKDVSKLKVERDMALAEVEELNASPNSPAVNDAPATLTRSLTTRFDNLKSQYKKDLEPLKQQREALIREINELKEARDIFLEETTALNARNEELAELNSQIQRQIEATLNESNLNTDTASISTTVASTADHPASSSENGHTPKAGKGMPMPNIFGGAKGPKSSSASIATAASVGPPSNSPSYSSVNTAGGSVEDHEYGARVVTSTKVVYQHAKEIVSEPTPAKGSKFKWFGGAMKEKKQKQRAHNFTAVNIMRFARCEHCNDKMWGPQFRCQGCGITCHQRCQTMIQTACQQSAIREDASIVDISPLPPSMFGRDLVEQVKADAYGTDRAVPVIVEKCIEAVEALAMDYEGIYRKTGGSGQSKVITQLFEKGNYDAFDLRDTDSFNDICSVTSVLKNYFRALPNPLLTYALHDAFVGAACIRDPNEKSTALANLVRQLPREHYHTLRALMLHLYNVQRRSDENLMNARNLGVVFGPTLMRSNDPSKEFADMAGKALSVEWLVEHALEVFKDHS
ncbi:hypothetical protein FRC05_011670 [Tulasnella sp. 425]|nr:hypothetical protein FRC05_011670 [Tulasnella sp. 425]